MRVVLAPALALFSLACAAAPAQQAFTASPPSPDVPPPVAASASASFEPADVPCPVPKSERVKPGVAPPHHSGPHVPFVPSPIERWRPALEGYAPHVTLGSQMRFGVERGICWAAYLNEMHKRIHPLFADSFLEGLDQLPPSDPMNDAHLTTRLEVVLTKDGHIQQMGVVRSSGLKAFDAAVLDSVDRAQPFGLAPDAILSADGFAYLQWEFRRNEIYACSTMLARPYVLATAP